MPGEGTRRALLGSAAALALAVSAGDASAEPRCFERTATLPVYLNLPESMDPKSETVAEIAAATPDGMTVVYTDSPGRRIGLVDIADPSDPAPAGSIEMDGEPTSVTVVAGTALMGVDTSPSYTAPSGHVALVDLATRTVAGTCAEASRTRSRSAPTGASSRSRLRTSATRS